MLSGSRWFGLNPDRVVFHIQGQKSDQTMKLKPQETFNIFFVSIVYSVSIFAHPMEEKEQSILDQATALFMQYGVKSLTMDDLARQMGISKKTLYQVVSDKAELVANAIQHYIDTDRKELELLHEKSENAVEEMFLIAQRVSEHLRAMHPSILYDLEKYYPKAFRLFEEYKLKIIMACVARNIEDGIAQGLYRANLNIPIVAGLYIGRMDVIFDQRLFPLSEYNITDVYFEAIRYHIRGIASEKGSQYLKRKLKKMDQKHPIFQ